MTVRFVLAAMTLGLAACGSTSETAAPSGPLVTELRSLTGTNAIECGLVPLGADSSAAWNCAERASLAGRPYWFAMEHQGTDSDVWTAALLTPGGTKYILTYDSNPMGGPGLAPRFSRDTCLGTIVLADRRFAPGRMLQCSRR